MVRADAIRGWIGAALLGAAVLVAGCAMPQPSSDGSGGGTVTMKGSDTMVILGQKWAEVYMKEHPDTKIQVTGGGSGTGIAALVNGTTQIAQASRPMKDKEREQVRDKSGAEVKEFVVAKDGVTVYVSESNPLTEISKPQLKAIYTGKVKNWKDVGGPDMPIVLYSRENNSGTYAFFKEHVLEDEDFAAAAQTLPGTSSVVNAVAKDKGGIGYGGVAYTEGVKALKVKKDDTSQAFEPTKEFIVSGDYPLARDLYLYTAGEPEGAVKQFIEWTLTEQGQKIVEDVEYVPVL